MTDNIIAFPTMFERDQIEFDRKGESNYTRASGEARALYDAVKLNRDRAGLAQRVHAITSAVEHLARYRPEEDLRDMVILNDGAMISLQFMPGVLRSMLAAT